MIMLSKDIDKSVAVQCLLVRNHFVFDKKFRISQDKNGDDYTYVGGVFCHNSMKLGKTLHEIQDADEPIIVQMVFTPRGITAGRYGTLREMRDELPWLDTAIGDIENKSR